MAKTESLPKAMVFHRLVKAQHGHQFAGLYAVEKIYVRDSVVYKSEIAHEWDLRAFSEAALARLGGGAAYDAYVEDHALVEPAKEAVVPAKPREVVTEEDVKNDMKLRPE